MVVEDGLSDGVLLALAPLFVEAAGSTVSPGFRVELVASTTGSYTVDMMLICFGRERKNVVSFIIPKSKFKKYLHTYLRPAARLVDHVLLLVEALPVDGHFLLDCAIVVIRVAISAAIDHRVHREAVEHLRRLTEHSMEHLLEAAQPAVIVVVEDRGDPAVEPHRVIQRVVVELEKVAAVLLAASDLILEVLGQIGVGGFIWRTDHYGTFRGRDVLPLQTALVADVDALGIDDQAERQQDS
ncbi:hypothetical protein TYRP_016167 [Tyrophagus putrescentiae]|nr:hypothetical protein TYRP_016167 [Tyrophagus putrescentiae]